MQRFEQDDPPRQLDPQADGERPHRRRHHPQRGHRHHPGPRRRPAVRRVLARRLPGLRQHLRPGLHRERGRCRGHRDQRVRRPYPHREASLRARRRPGRETALPAEPRLELDHRRRHREQRRPGTIAVPPNPHWLDLSPDGTRLYAADHESNLVTTIDTATDAVVGTLPVGQSPHALVRHRSKPLLFDADYDGNTVSVTNVVTGRVVAAVPTANHPQDVSLSADGRYLLLVAVDANAVQVLDTDTLQITATVPVGRGPTSVAVARDGRQAYVTNLVDGTVTVLDVGGAG
ncbi:MAG TPA: beta-propeller fold lactonase family protein [Actinomycetospora sp.]|uniref:beta-propeller fold lactonase family protein n=1 Tax=Actinomycetospora sp. TaxID=1872135 RepID=UPI002F417F5F